MNFDPIQNDIIYQPHTDELIGVMSQPTTELIYRRNAELRKNKGALHDLCDRSEGGSFGRQIASIPISDYYEAIENGYNLNSKDAKIATSEMMRFLNSEQGKKSLVVNKILTPTRPGIIIK
jgi:hypothetical protein